MSDRDLVTTLRAGDRLAAGQVYDVYGTRLYAYCHELLADPRLAADALRDTFIVAVNRIRELAEPEEFGAWLYALARAECDRVGISDDAPADAASAARGDRLARLALDVYSMLEPEERELLDLAFRHRLVDNDLALVLGRDESGIAVEVTRAQADLETALLVVLAARTGEPRCDEAAQAGRQFDEIDGKGVPVWLRAASKHVEGCAVCGDAIRNRRPLRLFEELPHAFMPPGVRSRVLEALRDPAGAAFAEQIVERSGKFDANGFPTGGGRGGGGFSAVKKWMLPGAGLVAAAACAVALVMYMTNDHPAASADVTTTSSSTGGSVSTASTYAELAASSASGSASTSASASASATTSSAAATTVTTAAGQQTTATTAAAPTTKTTTCVTVTTTKTVTVKTSVPVTITVTPSDSASPVYTTTSMSPTTTTSASPVTSKSCN
ncbi:sigma-70 family RNA polymerase sigma factor [Actinospica sp. MGRD01-02]|uniref:Sigma-70 family RNA polymerase sigma factor n=1 Tax=Actinospica acidithermotolerans TaxID=2828514 RepID=A0A941E8R7_9ACTN|nr:sigma-70 family RNA polymerase sigma factor [Actinospica acidithermotolerans]MBR7825877.1 sigma-70 family RNA polymerase sigma factor [Actinospica acidithermotolerans]